MLDKSTVISGIIFVLLALAFLFGGVAGGLGAAIVIVVLAFVNRRVTDFVIENI